MMSLVWEKKFQQFSLDALQTATNYFNESNFIGKGGFGSVYKGELDDGSATTLVAVKRLNEGSKQGIGEFETEIKMLSKCKHCHVVELMGYCNTNEEMILVYEYMSHGSLADHLYKIQDSLLTWEKRLKICIGAARGLDYLDTGTSLSDKVIHLDVKSANILLDENLEAKIADFGLSKIGPANQPCSGVMTDHIRGTRGYIDPQYLKYRKISRKSDVYAFGVVLLEVLCGKRPMDGDREVSDLAKWIQQHISNRTLNQIIDRRVLGTIKPECLQHFSNTISTALQQEPKKRPSMSEVVAQLVSALDYQTGINSLTSIVDGDLYQHFNAVSNQTRSYATLESVSDNKDALKNHDDSTESEAETSIDLEDSAIWRSMGISMSEYLGKAKNIFGEPIRNKAMLEKGLNPTRENKAQVAYKMMNQGNKYDIALRFVKLTYTTSRNWFGDIGPSPYPAVIMNGQWGAYLHTKIPKMPSGSVAAVVYRGRYSDNAFCDYMITWSIPWQRFTQDNAAYCEINQVGHFDGAAWDAIYRKTPLAGRESSAEWKDCYTRVKVESDTSPIFKAILTHVNVEVTSV